MSWVPYLHCMASMLNQIIYSSYSLYIYIIQLYIYNVVTLNCLLVRYSDRIIQIAIELYINAHLDHNHLFTPIAIESSGGFGSETLTSLNELGHRIKQTSGECSAYSGLLATKATSCSGMRKCHFNNGFCGTPFSGRRFFVTVYIYMYSYYSILNVCICHC